MLEDAAQARQNMAREGSGGSDSFLPSRYLALKETLAALFLGEVTPPSPPPKMERALLCFSMTFPSQSIILVWF